MERFQASIRSREISPELVLVDPEIARVARAALGPQIESLAATGAAPTDVEPSRERASMAPVYYALDPPRPSMSTHPARRRQDAVVPRASRLLSITAPAILSVTLLVTLALAGELLGGIGTPELEPLPSLSMQPSPARMQQEPAKALPIAATRPPHRQAARHRTNLRAIAKADAERTVIGLVQSAPRSRISALIDGMSGPIKKNVQAVCRRHADRGSPRFLCVVRPVGAPHGAGLYVRYTPRPRGWSVTWLGYREG